jgi:hypothetical protein
MRLFLTILLALCLCTPAAAVDEAADLAQTNRLLQAEYDLAKSQTLYFVIDLPAHRILFRASGTTLAELPILSLRSWGRPADGISYTLAKKSARDEPVREQVLIPPAPGKEPEKPVQPVIEANKPAVPTPPALQALEIADMPTEYVLQLDDGTLLTVHADLPEGGTMAKLRQKLTRLSWFFTRPLISVWQHWRGNSYNEMLLTLPEREARMLYWSFQEGARCLVRWP